MIILGIDPGSARIGFGIISKNLPAQAGKELQLIDYGVIEHTNSARSTDASRNTKAPTRIESASSIPYVAKEISDLIKKYKPELAGIEKLYFSKNVKTGIEVAQTRGAIILEIAKNNIPIKEFSPSEIKKAITGYGSADKKSVSKMVSRLLNTGKLTGFDDASDALAIALTAAMSD